MDLPPVPITLAARTSPSPKTTALPFFFAERTFARGIYDGIVVAERACGVDIGRWGRGELGVEGVEDAERSGTSAAIPLSFSGLLRKG